MKFALLDMHLSFTLCILMDSSLWFETIKLGLSIKLYISRGVRLKFSKNIVFLSEDLFYLYK